MRDLTRALAREFMWITVPERGRHAIIIVVQQPILDEHIHDLVEVVTPEAFDEQTALTVGEG